MDQDKDQQGIQSLEVAGTLLRTLAVHARPMMLKDLAAGSGMPAAKAHRYLVSFIRLGLVEQEASTGRYELGSFALQLGLAALNRLDPVRFGTPVLAELRDALEHSTAMAVWGTHGATIVRWEEASDAVTVNLRTGAVMPLLSSAIGRCFLAYSRPEVVASFLEAELTAPNAPSREEVQRIIDEVRGKGVSRVKGELLPGIHALCAPVFDHQGHIVLALTVVAPAALLDVSWDGRPANVLKEAAQRLSTRLGCID